MLLYHGSNKRGIDVLKPSIADHKKAYVYLSTNKITAAFYLINPLKKPYYFVPYGFDENGVPVYHELYKDALRDVSERVGGCIYTVDADEGELVRLPNIPIARLSEKPVPVCAVEEIDDCFEWFLQQEKSGLLKISRFCDKTPRQLQNQYDMILREIEENRLIEEPSCSYARFIREKMPQVWQSYIDNV